MLRSLCTLSVLTVFGIAAACDSTTMPPARPWTIDECVDAPGPEALVVGLDVLACFSENGLAEVLLDTAGFTGGESYLFLRGDHLLAVLDRADFSAPAYSIDMRTGLATRLSVAGSSDSQIARAGHGAADRYLITDYLRNATPIDEARFAFTWLEDGVPRAGTRLTLPDIGSVALRDTDYDPMSNRSAHLFSGVPEDPDVEYGQYLLIVDHRTGSYILDNIPISIFAISSRFTQDGMLLVLDAASSTVFAVSDPWMPVLDLSGQPDDVTYPRLVENRAGDVFTFTAAEGGTRVLRFLPGGATEEVLRLRQPQRVLAISLVSDDFCFRTFRPSGWTAPTYTDTIRVVHEGQTKTWPVTLRTDTYEWPRLYCR